MPRPAPGALLVVSLPVEDEVLLPVVVSVFVEGAVLPVVVSVLVDKVVSVVVPVVVPVLVDKVVSVVVPVVVPVLVDKVVSVVVPVVVPVLVDKVVSVVVPVVVSVLVEDVVSVVVPVVVPVLVDKVVSVVVPVVVSVSGGVVVVGDVAQPGVVNVLSSRETWPLRASARPATAVPVVTVIDVNAMIVPTKFEFVPSVAELPTCQYTLHACAPLIKFTSLAGAVINVDATWKIHTVSDSP
nr:hypothetical protein [Amycolatopsis sp. Hca4]